MKETLYMGLIYEKFSFSRINTEQYIGPITYFPFRIEIKMNDADSLNK